MKKILMLLMCVTITLCSTACGSSNNTEDNQKETQATKSINSVLDTRDKVINEIKNSKSVTETNVSLTETTAKDSNGITSIVYNTYNDVSLILMIDGNAELIGCRVEGPLDSIDEVLALAAGTTAVSAFDIDSSEYSKIGEVIKNKYIDQEIKDGLLSTYQENEGKATFYLLWNK